MFLELGFGISFRNYFIDLISRRDIIMLDVEYAAFENRTNNQRNGYYILIYLSLVGACLNLLGFVN